MSAASKACQQLVNGAPLTSLPVSTPPPLTSLPAATPPPPPPLAPVQRAVAEHVAGAGERAGGGGEGHALGGAWERDADVFDEWKRNE
jgi:hypothetical protein